MGGNQNLLLCGGVSLFTGIVQLSVEDSHEHVQVCPAKEMCLALLEQMELVSPERVFVYFLLLQPLQQGEVHMIPPHTN